MQVGPSDRAKFQNANQLREFISKNDETPINIESLKLTDKSMFSTPMTMIINGEPLHLLLAGFAVLYDKPEFFKIIVAAYPQGLFESCYESVGLTTSEDPKITGYIPGIFYLTPPLVVAIKRKSVPMTSTILSYHDQVKSNQPYIKECLEAARGWYASSKSKEHAESQKAILEMLENATTATSR